MQEIYGNICQQHERFKAELLRAMECEIKIVVLCEHGEEIKSLEDVKTFYQPETERYTYVMQEIAGAKVKVKKKYIQKPIKGESMYKSLCTIRDRYDVDFVFCTQEQTGKKIVEILSNDK